MKGIEYGVKVWLGVQDWPGVQPGGQGVDSEGYIHQASGTEQPGVLWGSP